METKEAARGFWRDLMGTLWHNPDIKGTRGIMSTEMIADYMNISVDKAEGYLIRCKMDDLRLTERQGGGWVV